MTDYLLLLLRLTIDMIAAQLFFDSFFSRKKQRIGPIAMILVSAFCASVILYFMPGRLVAAASILVFFLFHWLTHASPMNYRIYFAVIFYAMGCVVDNLVYTGYLSLNQWQYQSLVANYYVNAVLGIISHGMVFLICVAILRVRRVNPIDLSNGRLYTIPTALSAICAGMVFYLNGCYRNGQIAAGPLFVCAAFIAVFDIAAVFLVSWIEQTSRARADSLSLQAQVKAQSEGIEALSAANAAQRKMTHDFRAHLEVLSALLHQNETQKARDYIQKLHDEQNERLFYVNTHHASIDAILNQKTRIAQNHGIDVQFQVNDLSGLQVNPVDITVVISNLMDNAIEACDQLEIENRQIHIKAVLEDEFFFSIRNTSLPVTVHNNSVATTKKDTLLHGYGLQNVKTILSRYDSLFGIDYKDGWFLAYLEIAETSRS